jgi:N-acyl-D-amino-acid deacylase
MLDLVLRHVSVVDGSGRPAFLADVGVRGDTIAAVGDLHREEGRRRLDLDGLAVAPGFIDLHSHTDHLLFVDPSAESKVLQGVTTEVGGNCGFSPAPLDAEAAAAVAEDIGGSPSWNGMGEFLTALSERPLGLNFACLAGHGSLRASVMGRSGRRADGSERARLAEAAAQALAEGACGLSAGPAYAPGCYAEEAEFIEFAGALRGRHGFLAVHLRSEGRALLDAVDEMIRVARQAAIPLHISHLKASGREYWAAAPAALERLEAARADGLDVTADQYPYLATNTTLSSALPDWVADGGRTALLARLADPAARARIAAELGDAGQEPSRWRDLGISLVRAPALRRFEGISLDAVCRLWGKPPWEAICDLLLEDAARTEIIRFTMSEETVEMILRRPWVMVGSDASAKGLSGPRRAGRPHPRGFGTFPRLLRRYVRERGILSVEEAVAKMTSRPAARLGLFDRGLVRPGGKADLVVFDPVRVADRATYEDPWQPPAGLSYVLVNGRMAAAEGRLTGEHAGRVLRWPRRV